jgi:hypothetical protein
MHSTPSSCPVHEDRRVQHRRDPERLHVAFGELAGPRIVCGVGSGDDPAVMKRLEVTRIVRALQQPAGGMLLGGEFEQRVALDRTSVHDEAPYADTLHDHSSCHSFGDFLECRGHFPGVQGGALHQAGQGLLLPLVELAVAFNGLLRQNAGGNVVDHRQLRTPSLEGDRVPGDVGQHLAAILELVLPHTRAAQVVGGLGHQFHDRAMIIRRPDVGDGHGEKLAAGVAVMSHRSIIDREKSM